VKLFLPSIDLEKKNFSFWILLPGEAIQFELDLTVITDFYEFKRLCSWSPIGFNAIDLLHPYPREVG